MSSFACSCAPSDAKVPGTRWAILIGIDNYVDNEAQVDLSIPRLRGCVNDVRLVETFLCESTDIAPDRIHKLTTPRSDQTGSQAHSDLPTYDNIVKLFRHITAQAKKDDLVYIHYSGHGARVKSIFDHLKQEGGNLPTSLPPDSSSPDTIKNSVTRVSRDEALVPYDVGSGGRYLRDVELVVLLGEMFTKGLLVTTVLDCCHSGGMNRGDTPRGLPKPDDRELATDERLFQKNELQTAYSKLHGAAEFGARAARVGEHWLFGSLWARQVLFAACGEREKAAEAIFDNEYRGVFTHFLVEQLKTGTDWSCHEIHWLVSTAIQRKHQNPLVAGEKSRRFFRRETSHLLPGLNIDKGLNNDLSEGSPMELLAGSIHGVIKGDVFDVWHSCASNFDRHKRLARISVQEVFEDRCQGILTDLDRKLPASIKMDCIATPVQKYSVKIPLPWTAGLQAVAEALNKHDNVSVLTENHQEADLRVTEPSNGDFQLQRGNRGCLEHPVPHLTKASHVCHVLDHISRYNAILDSGHIRTQRQELGVSLELGFIESDKVNPAPRRRRIESNDNINHCNFNGYNSEDASCSNNSWVVLRVKNDTPWSWKIVIMALGSSWEVNQLLPEQEGACYEELGRHSLIDLPIKLTKDHPPRIDSETVVFKVFFSSQPVSFRWMELPKLALQDERRGAEVAHKVVPGLFSLSTYSGQPSYVCRSLRVRVRNAA